MTKFNVTRVGLALGVAAAIALSGGLARADLVKCGTGIESKTTALQNTLLKDLYKVRDAMKKGPMGVKLAASVDKTLSGFYGPGMQVDKFRTAISALSPATCADTDLLSLGFLLSGPGNPAPPQAGPTIKFTEDYLLATAESNAFGMMLSAAPLFSNDLLTLQQTAACPGTYPYLCNLKPECMERVCGLGKKPAEGGNSTSTTQTYAWALGSAPYNVPPASPALDHLEDADPIAMCFMDGDLQWSTTKPEPGVVYLTSPAKVRSLEIVDLGSPIFVCVDTLRSSGYCDCSTGGSAGLKNMVMCQDRDSLKTCGSPPTNTSTGLDACNAPCTAQQADPNYPGDYNGLPWLTASVATGVGDCVQQLTNQFTVLTSPHMYGPDGAPCTSDDIGGVNSPTAVVLTTGSSMSTLKNAVTGYGACDADPTILCVNKCEDHCVNKFCQLESPPVACKTDAGCNPTCTGTVYDVNTSVNSPSISGHLPVILGGDLPQYGSTACERYQQNHLKGMSLAGTFPGSASGQLGGLGDNLNVFHMDCK
jgi:hypothetical protein